MPYVKTTWVQGQLPAANAAALNRIEQGIADLYTVVHAEDAAEVTSTATGAFQDPTTGAAGPITPDLVIPAGGRFVDLQAECEAHHSNNNTDGIFFVIQFSKDGAAYTPHPPAGYQNSTAYMDTTDTATTFGASMWYADSVYRPLRLGQARTPRATAGSSFLWPSATRLFLLAGTWKFKMTYGLNSGAAGTAYFRTRRLRAQVLAQ